MINFNKAKFIKSAPTYEQKPEKNLKEIVFVGKSNVGKSSLINALIKNKNLAKTSSKPGYTKLLNYFEIDEKFYLVDAPGYGYTASGGKLLDSFSKMMETNLLSTENTNGILFSVTVSTPTEAVLPSAEARPSWMIASTPSVLISHS